MKITTNIDVSDVALVFFFKTLFSPKVIKSKIDNF